MDANYNPIFHRETVLGSADCNETVVYQRGRTAVCAGIRVTVQAIKRGAGVALHWKADSNIPARFAASVVQGVQEAIGRGVLAGLEVTDVLVSIEDGICHDIDSNEPAFRQLAQKATLAALREACPIVLEAISICRVLFPNECATAITEFISRHQTTIDSRQSEFYSSNIIFALPTSSIGEALRELASVTQGKATLSIDSGGFRPKRDPRGTVNTWPFSKRWCS